MGVSTVKLNGTTLMTVNDTTAVASDVASGEYFYAADGVKTAGTASGGGDYMVQRCEGVLTSYESDEVTTITHSAFRDCSELTSIKVYNCQTLTGGYLFYNAKLEHVAFPGLISVGQQSLTSVAAGYLKTLDFGENFTTIGNLSWSSNNALATIIFRSKNTIPNLTNINAFSGTPFASGGTGGTIYIPKVLYDHLGDGGSLDYKSAANWSTIDGYGTVTWAKIEGTTYETHYADGTSIS